MSNEETKKENAIVGFQIPLSIRQRKDKIDEMIKSHDDINELFVLSCFNGMGDEDAERVAAELDGGNLNAVADRVREYVVREIAKGKIKEVVRKKPGGGGYVLYAPNKGKKGTPKQVGSFPTRLGAKRAELSRFPPKDPQRLVRLRKEVDKLARRAAGDTGSKKHESLEVLRPIISKFVAEALMVEEKDTNWDDYLTKASNGVLSSDSKFQNIQKNINKKKQAALEDAFASIYKVLKKDVKLKSYGVKTDNEKNVYLAFEAEVDGNTVTPMYIRIENNVPKIDISDSAKMALTRIDASKAKLFRAELLTIQERVLDNMNDLEKAIVNRDKYLDKIESEVDDILTDMSPVQLSMFKRLLSKKYGKKMK